MKKQQKRYQTEAQILAEIDRCHGLGVFNLKSAEDIEAKIKDGKARIPDLEKGNEEERAHALWIASELPKWRLEKKKAERRATRYLEGRMKVLKDVLARFRTGLLPMAGNTYQGVVER